MGPLSRADDLDVVHQSESVTSSIQHGASALFSLFSMCDIYLAHSSNALQKRPGTPHRTGSFSRVVQGGQHTTHPLEIDQYSSDAMNPACKNARDCSPCSGCPGSILADEVLSHYA